MKEAESYQLEMTVSDIPFIGTINMKQMVDGNVSYTSAIWFQDEQYEEKVGKDVYVYTKNAAFLFSLHFNPPGSPI